MTGLPAAASQWQDEGMQLPQHSSEMIGRDSELRALSDSYALADESKPQAVVISGEAGLGKTRLVQEFLHNLPHEARVLVGQCVDLGPLATPYAPIVAILRALAADIGVAALMDLAGPGGDAVALLLPEAGWSGGQGPSPNRVLEAVSTVLEKASASRPLVVVVEDLHWADDSTLAILRFILRAFNGGRFLLTMTYRSDDVRRGHPLRTFLTEAERGRYVKAVSLGRLDRVQVRQLMEAITEDAVDYEFVENVFARSDGIPFFVEELVGLGDCATPGDLPSSLKDLLLARYERLEEPVQYFLRVLAAGGVSVRHSQAELAFDRQPGEFEASARAALRAELICIEGECYSFRHALVREAIHADLLPGERTRFHTRYAQALEAAGPIHRDAAEIAFHWDAASVVEKTFASSLEAMSQARGNFAYSTAAKMGERALELWDRVAEPEERAGMPRHRLMARTAAAHSVAGDGERSLAVIRLALQDPASTGTDRARLLAAQARYLGFNAKPGSGALLLEAIELTPPGCDDALRAELLNSLAARYMLEARLAQAVETSSEALALSTATANAAEQSVASNIRGTSRINAGDIPGGRSDLEAAEKLALGDTQALLRFRVNYSDTLNLLGLYSESIRVAEEGIVRARERGEERTSGAILSSNAVEPLFARGDWARATALLDRNLSLSPPSSFHGYLVRSRIWSTLWGGDVPGAEALFRQWQPLLRSLAGVEMQSRLHLATLGAELAWAGGRLDAAWQEAAFLLDPEFLPLPGYDLPLLAVAARVFAARRRAGARLDDDAGRLRAVLDRDSFWPTHPAWLALFDAELGGPGLDGGDLAAWHRAGTYSTMLPAHLGPYIALRTGQSEFASGMRPEASATLAAAVEGAEGLGALLSARLARDFAAQAGLSLGGPKQRPGGDGLTEREGQVLALVAGGLSNRQIGEQLFISAKTASVHVSAIMRKLGVSSRTEAAARALSGLPSEK
jgi:DNA-binding NarL/FixJ family response regulator/tetratricopeptide (TPR) repeat protein